MASQVGEQWPGGLKAPQPLDTCQPTQMPALDSPCVAMCDAQPWHKQVAFAGCARACGVDDARAVYAAACPAMGNALQLAVAQIALYYRTHSLRGLSHRQSTSRRLVRVRRLCARRCARRPSGAPAAPVPLIGVDNRACGADIPVRTPSGASMLARRNKLPLQCTGDDKNALLLPTQQ